MKLSLSILTTAIIAFVVWLIMLWQPEESWSDGDTNEQSVISQQYSDNDDVVVNTPVSDVKLPLPELQNVVESDSVLNQKMIAIPAVINTSIHTNDSVEIVGISRRIALDDIALLWREFTDISRLQRALVSNEFDVYAIYHGFNSDYIPVTLQDADFST